MVVVRLSRRGSKKRPYYCVVAADSRSPRDGKFLDRVGRYDPLAKSQKDKISFDSERLSYWKGNGARLSDRVAVLWRRFLKLSSIDAEANDSSI